MDVDTILEDSISLFGDEKNNDTLIQYGSIRINIPPKEGKALTLLADQLFSPSFALTELLERGEIPCAGNTWLELGSGTGLVSIVAATMKQPPATVVITDYSEPLILENLKANVSLNQELLSKECEVEVHGYIWGSTVDHLLSGPARSGFGIVIMSDLLYFDKSHATLLESVRLVLARNKEARLFVAAGKYTPTGVCESFLKDGVAVGLLWEEISIGESWQGTTRSGSYAVEDLQSRKSNSRVWVGRWDCK